MTSGRTECTVLWTVKNFSFHGKVKAEPLRSPVFIANSMEKTEWCLWLFPRGWDDADDGFVSLYLFRYTVRDGPKSISIQFELSALAEDGSALAAKEYSKAFGGYAYCGDDNFFNMDEQLHRMHFPRDVLVVRCKMWRDEAERPRVERIWARTRVGVEKTSFVHEVTNFSILKANQKHTQRIPFRLRKEYFTTTSVYYTYDSCSSGEMSIEIGQSICGGDSEPDGDFNSVGGFVCDGDSDSNRCHILCKRRIYLLGFSGNRILCANDDNRFDVKRKDIMRLPLSITRQGILMNKNEYFPDDKLSLLCEYTFSTGLDYEKIEETQYNIPQEPIKNICSISEKASAHPSALDDLRALYMNESFTDVQLKSKSKSFPAHKAVLCARSPVFATIFSSDMRERNTACVQVDDLEDDVVQQLLMFLYSDNVQDLEWTMATRLYYAADKYQVERLKAVASSFLLEHLSPNTAGELLLLADTHSDADLRRVVEEFIFGQEQKVFSSKEWEMLMKTHPLLALETMHLKYKR